QGASASRDSRAGTNPQQVGLGTSIGSIDNNMSSGNLESTGKDSDVAIQGDGFFVLRDGSSEAYSRAGNFGFDEEGNLYSQSNGMLVQGWKADDDGEFSKFNNDNIGDINLQNSINAVETNKIEYGKNLDAAVENDFNLLNQNINLESGGESDSMNFDLQPLSGSDYNKWSFELAADNADTEISGGGENFGSSLSGEVELDQDGNIIGFEGITESDNRIDLLDQELEIDINGSGEVVNYKTIAENESINEVNLLNRLITEEIDLGLYNESDLLDFVLEPQEGSDFKKWDVNLKSGDVNTTITDGTNNFGSEIEGELELDEAGNVLNFTGLSDAGSEVSLLGSDLEVDINGSGETAVFETIDSGESIESKNIFTEKISDIDLSEEISRGGETDDLNLNLDPDSSDYNQWDFNLDANDADTEFSVDGSVPADELTGDIIRDQNGEIEAIETVIDGSSYDLLSDNIEVNINGSEIETITLADHFNLQDNFSSINEVNINDQVELAENNYLEADYELNAQRNITVDAFDSQGDKHNVNFVIEKIANNNWQINEDSLEVSGVESGSVELDGAPHQITFDEKGNIESGQFADLSFIPDGPKKEQTIELDFSKLTQFANSMTADSENVNGNADGALESFSFTESGNIEGAFDNGLSQTLAKIALADFSNPAGLKRKEGAFERSANSGDPKLGAAAEGGRGSLAPSNLEMSNANLSKEFTKMITAQRGFQANSKVITTSDEMLQELTNLKR
ncbi:MAG: flagellar hook-basal body complex protein, partial [Halanaerobium sp.]